MKEFKLVTEYRDGQGKGHARKLRAGGGVPGVIYGQKEDTVPITIDERELKRMLSSEVAIVDLEVKGKVTKECEAIVKDVQQHPGTGRILHVDFQYVRRGEKINVEIPVRLNGMPRGVKDMGGILEHGLRTVRIRCLPRYIPEHIEVNVEDLGIHDGIKLRDVLDANPDLEFLDEPDSTLAIVVPPKIEAEPAAELEEEEAEEPEVISKGKEEKAEEPKQTEESGS